MTEKPSKPNPKIVIAGAGSIGCFVGGLLAKSELDISLLARDYLISEIAEFGLQITDYTGLNESLQASQFTMTSDPKLLSHAHIILVCVKSAGTAEIAKLIKKHAPKGAIIISLQNGINNSDTLKDSLDGFDVRAGMVPFNVVKLGNGRFHRGSSGAIIVEAGDPEVSEILNVDGLEVLASGAMKSVLWGKLLLNLNNALNALSDMPLVDQLADRNWRRQFATLMDEAIRVLNAEGIKPKPPAPVPAFVIPYILRLPTPLFRLVAKQMLSIDPMARTSMWEDIQAGRKTEIDEFQGEVIRLGEKHSIATPANLDCYKAIKSLEEQSATLKAT